MSKKFIKRGVEDVAPYELERKVIFIPILLVKKRKTLTRFLKKHILSGASLPNPHQRSFLKKAPLETAKTFKKQSFANMVGFPTKI